MNHRLLEKIEEFAHAQYETSKHLYIKRNQPEHRIIDNIIQGKLAEWHVYKTLIEAGKDCTEPDMNIYSRNKSYDSDLLSNNKRIHVKSCNKRIADQYGLSWLVQKDGLLKLNRDDWYALCLFESHNRIKIHWANALRVVYRETKLNKSSKMAIYYTDLQ